MPYITKGSRICHPLEIKEANREDVVIVKPTTFKVNKYFRTYPPLSFISPSCDNEIELTTWADGYVIKGDEDIIFIEGEKDVKGIIEVEEPSFIAGYSLSKMLGEIQIKVGSYRGKGSVILSISKNPLIIIENYKIIVNTIEYRKLMKLAAYSLYYYLYPSSSAL
jgi:hypothetical protein